MLHQGGHPSWLFFVAIPFNTFESISKFYQVFRFFLDLTKTNLWATSKYFRNEQVVFQIHDDQHIPIPQTNGFHLKDPFFPKKIPTPKPQTAPFIWLVLSDAALVTPRNSNKTVSNKSVWMSRVCACERDDGGDLPRSSSWRVAGHKIRKTNIYLQ